MLRTELLKVLSESFGAEGFEVHSVSPDECLNKPLVTFPAKHPEVGDLRVFEEQDRIEIYIGLIARVALIADESNLTKVQELDLSRSAVSFIQQLLNDEIEFFGFAGSGATRARTDKRRSWWSRFSYGDTTYVWSGPISAA